MGTAPDRDYFTPPKTSIFWWDVLAAVIFGIAFVGAPLVVLGLQ